LRQEPETKHEEHNRTKDKNPVDPETPAPTDVASRTSHDVGDDWNVALIYCEIDHLSELQTKEDQPSNKHDELFKCCITAFFTLIVAVEKSSEGQDD